MDWGIVATVLIFILGCIGSFFGWVLAKQSKDANTIKKLETEKVMHELKDINSGIKRIHLRVDGIEATQDDVDKLLHDGEKGIFIRLNTLEHKTGVK
jgi:uncharacterized membrane protein